MDGISSTFIFETIFITGFSIISYFVIRTLKQIDSNQQRMFEKIEDMEIRLIKLQTEHDLMMCKLQKKED